MIWQDTKNYLIEVCLELLLFLFLYLGWGNAFLCWISGVPIIKSLLTPDDNIYFNIAFIVGVGSISVWIFHLVQKDLLIPSPSKIAISICSLIILFSCSNNVDWIFYKANYWGCKIAYWDLLGLIPALFLLSSSIKVINNYKPQIKTLFGKKKKGEETQEISRTALKDNDRPIENEDEDWLGRSRFAEDLGRRILEQDVKHESSSIAIIAPWGNGKTSFLNLIKRHIQKTKDTQHTIIDFSPWAYTSPVNVTKTFFETLALAVRPLNRKLASTIERYMRVLSGMNIPALSTIGKLYRPDDSLQALYNLIHDGLKKSNKTFIICIDDVDRLQATEILEVLKLIRGSANFPNLKFICAFDKQYVVQELLHKSTALSERFVEKFFQMEYWLPTYNLDKIRNAILNTCHDFLLEEDYIAIDEYLKINEKQSFGKSRHPLKNGVDNLRIAIRWIHSFKISYSRLKGNVLATDLADIELLKLIAPAFFDTLRSNWLSFVDETNNGLKLWGREEVDTGTHDDDWVRNLFIKEKQNIYSMDNYVTLSSSLQTHVKDILSRLLPEYGGGKDKSFSNRSYTDRYFFNSLQDDEIAETEFNHLMSKNLDDIRNTLKAPSFSNKFKWLSILLNKYEPKDLPDLLKYIHVIFYAGSISSEFQINPLDFVYKLKPYTDDCTLIGDEFKKAIHANRASMFTLKFFTFLKHGVPQKMYKPYTSDLTPEIVALEMLKYAVQDGKGFYEISEYFWDSGEHKHTGGKEEYIPNSDAVGIYRLYWEQNIQTLYPKLIYRQMPPDEDDTYVIAKLVTILWPNKEDFFKLFTNMHKDNAVTEAESFFKTALTNDHLIAQFKFKHLKIQSNK